MTLHAFLYKYVLLLIITHNVVSINLFAISDTIPPHIKVTPREAHIGDLEIDKMLLDSYILLPDSIRKFYLASRAIFEQEADIDFTNLKIVDAARENNISLMGGPLLGCLSESCVTVWIRPFTTDSFIVRVSKTDDVCSKRYVVKSDKPGLEQRIKIKGLEPDTDYKYAIYSLGKTIREGGFKTAPAADEKSTFKVTFGSCFHKIGVHNPNLLSQILKREPHAMMLLGDIAVDDRRNNTNLHRSDYLLRDVSAPWSQFAANVPLFTSWDDHDYFDDDLGGVPEGFEEKDRDAVRAVWKENWNNPTNHNPGIYFNKRIGQVEVIMLDTRSLRENNRRGAYGSYLGMEQFNWLKKILKKSTAQYKIISSGTMWSDYISNGKDSWGTWDTQTRDELFDFIESENIAGVLLISGDRHGARGFKIPRPSGFEFFEFQVASLGGLPGPNAIAQDNNTQLFGYQASNFVAFGEFVFDYEGENEFVEFRLISEFGEILEEFVIPYSILNPCIK